MVDKLNLFPAQGIFASYSEENLYMSTGIDIGSGAPSV